MNVDTDQGLGKVYRHECGAGERFKYTCTACRIYVHTAHCVQCEHMHSPLMLHWERSGQTSSDLQTVRCKLVEVWGEVWPPWEGVELGSLEVE